MFNSTLSFLNQCAELLLCAESLHYLLLDVGPVSECFELCHLPLHDALGGKGTKKFSYLIFRLGFNCEGPGESIDGDASRTDLAILP